MTVKRKDLIVDFVLGLLVVTFCYLNPQNPDTTVIHRMLDGCFVAGTLLCGAGVILFCSSKGAFNILGYGLKFGLNLILPVGKNPWMADGERESYYDYCVRKSEEQSKTFLHLLITGAVFMLASLVLLIIYLQG